MASKREPKLSRRIMEPPVIAALVALFGVILVPFINHHLVLKREGGGGYSPLSTARREALVGQWSGKAIQPQDDGTEINSTIKLEISTTSRKIKGIGEIRHKPPKSKQEIVEEFTLSGGFFADRFARLIFDDRDPARIQPGSMMLILTDDPKLMEGLYIGYGSETKALGMGRIELSKTT